MKKPSKQAESDTPAATALRRFFDGRFPNETKGKRVAAPVKKAK